MNPTDHTARLLGSLAVVAGLLGGAVTPPTSAWAKERDPRYAKARDATKAAHYGKAIQIYESVLKERPKDGPALLRLGPLYFLANRYARARDRYAKAVKRQPRFARGWYFYAYALRKLGDARQALTAYRRYRKLAPADPSPLYAMAQCRRALGQLDKALVLLTTFAAKAGTPQGKRHLDHAEAWIQRAMRQAEALRETLSGRRAQAAVKGVLQRAREALRTGNPQKAIAALRNGWSRLHHPLLIGDELTKLLVRQRKCPPALPVLRQMLSTHPKHFSARYRLALCLRLTGKLKAAALAYRAAIAQQPRHPDSHYGLAETLRRLGQLRRAAAVYRAYVALERRPTEQRWVTLARQRIAEIEKGLASRSAPRSAPARRGSLAGVTDPRIRALLAARRRFLQRQRGQAVPSTPGATGPGASHHESAADRARRRRDALRRRRAAARERRAEALRHRREEARRKRREARQRRAEARKRRTEALRRRRAEARKRRHNHLLARRARAWLRRRRRSPPEGELRDLLVRWARKATVDGKHARALSIWKGLAASTPKDPKVLAPLAQAALAAGEPAVAARAYRILVHAHPREVSLYRKLRSAERKARLPLTPLPVALLLPPVVRQGRALLRSGQPGRALSLARKHLAAHPGNGLVLVLAADALLHLRRFQAARAAARRALQRAPRLAGPHRILGDVLLHLRDRTAALAAYRRYLRQVRGDPTELPYRSRVQELTQRLTD